MIKQINGKAVVLLLLGVLSIKDYVDAIKLEEKIPDYWNDDRFQGWWTWKEADWPRYSNETQWAMDAPTGYKEQNIFAPAVIASQLARYDSKPVIMPYLLQTEAEVNIPDYWNDYRFDPLYTWEHTNNPRFGNETSWVESSPTGYKEANIMSDSTIAAQKAKWDKKTVLQPYLLQTEEDMEAPRHSLAQQKIPDYWNDYRQSPDYTWGHTLNPRFANETDWILESRLKGYDVPITMSNNELGKIQA